MEKNVTYNLKAKLRSGEKVFCAMIGLGNEPQKTVRALKDFGYDFVWVDREHTLMNKETIYAYVRATKEAGIPLLMRPEGHLSNYKCYLDSGVTGLFMAQLDTLEQAACVINQAYYLPIGHRGASIGMDPYLIDFQSPVETPYFQLTEYVNNNTIVFALTESLASVTSLPGILGLNGIEGTIVGTNDFMLDVAAIIGDADHDALLAERLSTDFMTEKLREIAKICEDTGKVAGIGGLLSAKDYARWAREGYQILQLGLARDGELDYLRTIIKETRALLT